MQINPSRAEFTYLAEWVRPISPGSKSLTKMHQAGGRREERDRSDGSQRAASPVRILDPASLKVIDEIEPSSRG